MKSLLITYDYPPTVGGIANVLATFWRLAGNSECLILAPKMEGAADHDRSHPVRTVRFPAKQGDGALAKALTSVSGALWTTYYLVVFRPDVVVAGQIVRAGLLAFLWGRLTGRPFYLWVYGGETSARFTAVGWTTRYLHRVLRRARYLFSISAYTSQEMVDFEIPRERVVEVPLGVGESLEPRSKDSEYVDRYGLEGKLVFMTLGRLVERKGVDTMLNALHDVSDDLSPWHYLIVSDGPYRSHLEQLTAELELEDRVTFTGYIEQRELPIYYNLCDVFAMPNREVAGTTEQSLSIEGFGIVFIEAAACRKPVIAGRSGGAVYAVEDGVNGIVVDPTDLTDLKNAILKLADEQVRHEMGTAGTRFAARFRWETSAEILRPYLEKAP